MVLIRKAVSEDLKQVEELNGEMGWKTTSLQNTLVAEEDERVVGKLDYFLRNKAYCGRRGSSVFVKRLVVKEGFRNRKIATALLEHVFVLAREKGFSVVELRVRENNPAESFYEKLGFREEFREKIMSRKP